MKDEAQDALLLLSAVADFLTIVEKRRPLLTSRRLDLVRQYAAAALVRGCDLIDAAAVSLEADRPEAVGVLARAGWECWLVGTFMLFGGDEAVFRMEAEQQRQERVLVERNGIDALDVLDQRRRDLEDAERDRRIAAGALDTDDETPITFDRLTLEKIAGTVGPLVRINTGDPADVSAAYDLFFRSHSAYDAHGIRSIERYMAHPVPGLFSVERSAAWIAPHRCLAIAAMYLSLLARWIFDEFGIGRGDLDDVQDRIVTRAGSVAEEVEADFRSWVPPLEDRSF